MGTEIQNKNNSKSSDIKIMTQRGHLCRRLSYEVGPTKYTYTVAAAAAAAAGWLHEERRARAHYEN